MFQFIWGEGRSKVILRKTIKTSVENGGLGLVRLKEKCQAIHLEHNLYRPCSLSFDHLRFLFFTYFLACGPGRWRLIYTLSQPHTALLSWECTLGLII